ncbi:MAG: hypothetical protein LBK04_03425 [Clostridiales Family XIII bacterium]|jgi:hypothetical protein|nr:hypothetical protein [Clostridiales Family XIII bacterium]
MKTLDLYGSEFERLQGELDALQDAALAHLNAYDSMVAIRSGDEFARTLSEWKRAADGFAEREKAIKTDILRLVDEEKPEVTEQFGKENAIIRDLQSHAFKDVESLEAERETIEDALCRRLVEETAVGFIKSKTDEACKLLSKDGWHKYEDLSRSIKIMSDLLLCDVQAVWSLRMAQAKRWIGIWRNAESVGPNRMAFDGYGLENREWTEKIRQMGKAQADEALSSLKSSFEQDDGFARIEPTPEDVIACLWAFAFATPHGPASFAQARDIANFHLAYHARDENGKTFQVVGLQSLLADLYVANRMGFGVLEKKKDYLFKWLGERLRVGDSENAVRLASGLMWMKATGLELEVLRRTAVAGLLTDAKLQGRLQFLESGGNKGPGVHEVAQGTEGTLQFDYSAVSWNDEDYVAFFKNLTYENKVLPYALTVREWSKTLAATGKPGGVTNDALYERIRSMVADEYDNAIVCTRQDGLILAEDTAEEISGVVLTPEKSEFGFDHIAQFINLIKIGRTLNIRCYILFLPKADTVEKQSQQAISLKKSLNPNIRAYEDSLRESTLHVIETFLSDIEHLPAE